MAEWSCKLQQTNMITLVSVGGIRKGFIPVSKGPDKEKRSSLDFKENYSENYGNIVNSKSNLHKTFP